jgi:hypothetical protein
LKRKSKYPNRLIAETKKAKKKETEARLFRLEGTPRSLTVDYLMLRREKTEIEKTKGGRRYFLEIY